MKNSILPTTPLPCKYITREHAETICLAAITMCSLEDQFSALVVAREDYCNKQGLYDNDQTYPRSEVRDYVWAVFDELVARFRPS